MSGQKTLEVVRRIAVTCLGSAIVDNTPLESQLYEIGWQQKLSLALREELAIEVSVGEIDSAGSLVELTDLIERRLARDERGQSLIDIYAAVERFVREELSHDVNYHWYAAWKGDLIRHSDSLDDVEILLRIEDAFGFSIPDRDVETMGTVGNTVRYLWQRSSKQKFTLRPRPNGACGKAFIFHELRRLLIIRGGVPHASVRLEVQLGDLLPTWHFQFWKEVQSLFGVSIPRGTLLSRSLGLEKRTTIKELVTLIASTENQTFRR
jgi:acyl carrier protein